MSDSSWNSENLIDEKRDKADFEARIKAHASINPFKLAMQAQQPKLPLLGVSSVSSQRSPLEAKFHLACCEFFNMVECLLRWVQKSSQSHMLFRPGYKCLFAVW